MTRDFNINNSDVVELTNKLERLHKSAMPVTVRKTINELAFNAKQKQVRKVFEDQFTIRRKGFIRSHTGVNKSPNTFDIKKMRSEFGVVKRDSSEGLERQEYGGKNNAKRIVQTKARIGETEKKRTSRKYYFNKYKKAKNGQVERTKQHTIIKTDYSILMVEKGSKWSTLYRLKRSSNWDEKPFIEPPAKLAHLQTEKIFRNLAKKRLIK